MLKAIHASEDVVAAREKAIRVIEKLRGFRLTKAAELAEAGIEETLTYYAFPEEPWRRIRTTDVIDKSFRAEFLEFVGDLVSFCGAGDCVAKRKPGGCEPCRAALASLLSCSARAPRLGSARLPVVDKALVGRFSMPRDLDLAVTQLLHVISVGSAALVSLLSRHAGLQLHGADLVSNQGRDGPRGNRSPWSAGA